MDRPFRGREGGTQLGVGATDNGSQSGTGAEFLAEDSKRQAGKALEAAEAAVDSKRERSLRREAEQEREALRRMCNCLTLDLNGAVEARAVAEDTRQILVQVSAFLFSSRAVFSVASLTGFLNLGHFARCFKVIPQLELCAPRANPIFLQSAESRIERLRG